MNLIDRKNVGRRFWESEDAIQHFLEVLSSNEKNSEILLALSTIKSKCSLVKIINHFLNHIQS